MKTLAVIILLAVASFAQTVNPPDQNSGGTVTSIATGCGAAGGTITTTGTIKASEAVNVQTGTTYAILDGDCGKLVTGTNGSAEAYSIAQANGSTFVAGWFIDLQNRGAGTLTLTPTTSTIDGATTLVLTTGQGARIVSDGVNYFSQRGVLGPIVSTNFPTTGVPAPSAAFAGLGSPANGNILYCSDCTVTSGVDNTCAASGTGAVANRINGAWKCEQ